MQAAYPDLVISSSRIEPRKYISWVIALLSRIYSLPLLIGHLIASICGCWRRRAMQYLFSKDEKQELHTRLRHAETFSEWHDVAVQLDALCSNDVWRSSPESADYDYKLIGSLKTRLAKLREKGANDELAEVTRSGLIRNMGSIATIELYTGAYSGTKFLIEDYIHEVILSLYSLGRAEDRMLRKPFFYDTRQSYGRTALVLHGGSLFGMCHLGVAKALLSTDLLPSVICGSTVGSIVAAYVCSFPSDEIMQAIERVPLVILAAWPQGADPKQTALGGIMDSALRSRFTLEILMFHRFVARHLGDMTFEEAYLISGRVLNILILPAGSYTGTFFNYLTTPKVLIRTAILASIGTGQLPEFMEVELLVKDYMGQIRPHPDSPCVFLPANHKTYSPPRKSPYSRLAELFNVNNYIVSVSRPYFAPMLLSEFKYRGKPRLWQRAITIVRMSAQYRIGQLADWGIVSQTLKSVFLDEIIPGGFQVNVVPEPDALLRDVLLVLDTANIWQKAKYWIRLGESSVWPQLSIIWARSKVEFVLEEMCEQLRASS